MLLVLTLITLQLVAGGGLGEAGRWVTCFLLLFGVLAQPGGLFPQLLPRKSLAHGVTVGGAGLVAAAMLMAAYGTAVA